MATTRRTAGKRKGRAWSYALLVLFLVGALVALVILMSRLDHDRRDDVATTSPAEPDSSALPPSRSVVLFFGRDDAEGMSQELREVRARDAVEEGVRAVIEELIRGPSSGGVPSIPPGTRLSKDYFDERSGILYLDFSKELKTQHWGGSEGELLTVRSILRTIAANFPAVKAVQILVEGGEVESIAGHVDTSEPFDLASWLRADREGPEGDVFEEPTP